MQLIGVGFVRLEALLGFLDIKTTLMNCREWKMIWKIELER